MQISKSFDPVTLGKVKRSALVSLGGFAIAAIPMLLPGILDALKGHPMVTALFGSFAPFLVNTIKEWVVGQPQS